MTAKLRVELDNKTSQGFDQITKDLDKMGIKGKDAEKALEQLNRELDSRKANEAAKAMKAYADELDGTAAANRAAAASMKEMEDAQEREAAAARAATREVIAQRTELQKLDKSAQAAATQVGKLADFNKDLQAALNERKLREYRQEVERLADAMSKGPGTRSESFTKAAMVLGGSLFAGIAVFKAVGEGINKVGQGVNYLAEKGVPAFQRLQQSGADMANAVVSIAKDDRLSQWVDIASTAISYGLVPSLKATANFVLEVGDYAYDAGKALAEMAGVSFAKQNKELDEQKKLLKALEEGGKASLDMLLKAESRKTEVANIWQGLGFRQESNQRNAAIDKLNDRPVGEISTKLQEANAELNQMINRLNQAADEHVDDEVFQRMKQKAERLASEIEKIEGIKQAVIEKGILKQKEKEKELKEARIAADKKAFESEIKHIDTLLKESTQSAEDIRDLEKRRFDLVKANKELERKLLIEAGTLEQKLFEEDMARIEARKKKERDAVLAGIEGERKLYLAREHRRDLERQAEQEKVDKFKEFLSGAGGGGGGDNFGGNSGSTQITFAPTYGGGGGGGHECCCPCPGGMGGGGGMPMGGQMPMQPQMPMWNPPPMMPPMWQGPNIPMPQGWHGQTPWPGGGPKPRPSPIGLLTGGIRPGDVWKQTVKNAQDEEEQRRIAEGQASGKLDQNGKPIDFKEEEKRQADARGRQWVKDQAKKLGIDVPGGDVQQTLGDERKPRTGWNTHDVEKTPLWVGGKFLDEDDPIVYKDLQAEQAAQKAKLKAAADARTQTDAEQYKKIQELTKQEEEQKRKQESAEQTRQQAEKDKSENLPDLTTKAAEESKKLADIQKQKDEELKRIKEFEAKRRQESSERTKDAKFKNDGDFKKHRDEQELKRKQQEDHDAADAEMRWDDAERGGDGTGLDLWTSDEDRAKQEKAKAAATKQKRDRERKFSPDYGPETPKDRAETRRKATARAKGAERKSKAQTKTKTLGRAKRGEIRGPETTRAYHDLVGEQVQQLKNQGNLDQTQITAIEQLLEATRNSSLQTAEMQEKMDQLIEQIAELRGFRMPKSRRQAGR